MGSWGTWFHLAATAGNLPADCDYTLNMATDCSGLGVPELAVQAIGRNRQRMKINVVFACDTLATSRAFLARNANPTHMLADMTDRDFDGDSFITKTVDGKVGPPLNILVVII